MPQLVLLLRSPTTRASSFEQALQAFDHGAAPAQSNRDFSGPPALGFRFLVISAYSRGPACMVQEELEQGKEAALA